MFGRIIHQMSEAWSNGDDPVEVVQELQRTQGKMFKVEREYYGDILSDARIIYLDYLDYWGEASLVPVRMKGKAAEFTFEIDLGNGIIWKGTLDNVAVTPNKRRWLVEHKTFKQMPNEDHRWRNLQSSTYHRAAERLGLKLDGTCWDYIRSKPPMVPKFLKNGKLSKRGIDTLPRKIREFLKENKLPATESRHLLSFAEKNRKFYFNRIFTPIKKKVVDLVFDNFVRTAKEIAELGSDSRAVTMNIGRHCDWCEYEPLCRAKLLGNDVDFIKRKDYEKDTRETVTPDFEG